MIDETYPIEYLDINYLANIMYDYFYNPNSQKYYETKNINPADIKLEDIKIILPKNKHKQIINNFFNTKLDFYYRKLNKYILKRDMNVFSTDVELRLYTNDDTNNINSSENMNSRMTYLLSDFVVKGLTKNILLILLSIDIETEWLKDIFDKIPELQEINQMSNKIVSVTIFEHFFKMENLDIYATKKTLSDNDFKSIFAQLIYTLIIIQEKYPKFRHNNLKLSSIKLYFKENKTDIYTINNKILEISNSGLEIKITNFENSCIENIIDNADIDDSKKTEDNMYDLMKFINDIENSITNIPSETKQFISEIKTINNKKNKNILLLYIIMNNKYFSNNILEGGAKKNKMITGYRYLNNDNVFINSNNRTKDTRPEIPVSSDSFIRSSDKLSSISGGGLKKVSKKSITFSDDSDFLKSPKNPNMSNMSNMTNMTNIPNMPNMTNMPNMQQMQYMTNMQQMANMQPIANMPNMTNMTNMYRNSGYNESMPINDNQNLNQDNLIKMGIVPPSIGNMPLTSMRGGSMDEELNSESEISVNFTKLDNNSFFF